MLFGLARTVDKKSGWDVDTDITAEAAAATFANENNDQNGRNESEEENSDDSAVHNETENVVVTAVAADLPTQRSRISRMLPGSTTYSERRMPVLANLLYGLFTLALGVTGYFLPMNLFSCYGGSTGPYEPSSSGHWSTDISILPSDVGAWASSTQPNELSYATFAYISSAGAEQNFTLFQGSDNESGYNTQTLWSAATVGREPFNFPYIQNPSQFIAAGDGWACFTGIDATLTSNGNQQPKSNLVGCSNGIVVQTTDPTRHSFQGPYDFFINNNTLWFKDYPSWSGEQAGSGTLIYSIDNYDGMEVELHSTYTKSSSKRYDAEGSLSFDDEAANSDYDDICWTKHSVFAIFVSAVPVTLASIVLWLKRKAPAMAITSYIGVSACANFVYLAIAVWENDLNEFWGWWLSISAALYLAILCDLTHCKRGIARSPLIWGINVSAIAFFIGMIILTDIFGSSVAWPWIVFNVIALIPLLIVGIGYSQVFLLVLCAVGWLMTAVKIASALAALAAPAANVPIYFVVLAASGLLIAGAGWWLNKNQVQFGSVICYHMERISLSRRMLPDEELEESARREQGDAELQGEVSVSV
eukprot:CAMPEP_0201685836 /NCGR_PEP_ID=MMETSP0578-20130828/508_1 /ASSEMBLY_ACC=CAM_ASM_000663 /TAXON_ID=267565 /ORGANISM="Skeletonema grethea, Strain CCMP 1804" /LENGTH=587 /DNA_ID=CAMNT_0048169809 /DNA_START=406 /DNA_END=2169 /DNA_ORIENTATION=-